ncbi:hypothetical protein OG474_30445 [Kribbella sp. NBC_01505]|uniref:hypothetical protein n=1 Tax=Kribbella sp. NBC_01505 TaxID=2903580 RepID=UPI00386BAD46
MATSSFPFDNQDSTEDQYSKLFRELQTSGVADTKGGAALRVEPTGGMGLAVQAGFAIVRGHGFQSTATEALTLPAATSSTVTHLVILRLDPTANSITLVLVSGAANGGAPALTQTDFGIYEIALAAIEVGPNAVNIDPAKITDLRPFLGHQVTAWTADTRPAAPRMARLGFNTTTGAWEYYTGAAWKYLIEPDIYNRLTALETQPFMNRQDAQILGAASYNVQDRTSTGLNWVTAETSSGITYSPSTGRFVVSKPGLYKYAIRNTFTASAADAGRRHLNLLKNGDGADFDTRPAVKDSFTTLRLSGEIRLTPSDYLSTEVWHNAGGLLAMISTDGYQHFSLRRVGP